MRTDQWVYCEVCQWIVTVCVCPDRQTVPITVEQDGDAE